MWKLGKTTKFKSFAVDVLVLIFLLEGCHSKTLTNESVSTTTKSPVMTTLKQDLDLIPKAQVKAQISKKFYQSTEGCPTFEDADALTDMQLFERLVHPCRFDKIQRPEPVDEKGKVQPVDVFARAFIYFLQSVEGHYVEFSMQALLQFRYVDPRLVYKEVAPNRTDPILGEEDLRKKLWVPRIFFANEKESGILGTSEKDILTSVSPDGTVITSRRIHGTFYCSMNLRNFPFDSQKCSTVMESWMYKETDVRLHWEMISPVLLAPEQHFNEYRLLNYYTNESMVNADMRDLRHGAFIGNYSSLSFTVNLQRQLGFYLLGLYFPSNMIVAISWVSFWLQADQTAPRVMLGTTTMLTLITLTSAQGKSLPKVSYIKSSEIWCIGCMFFIFSSLVEFAFVNVIWRRRKNIAIKEISTKHILRHTLAPRAMRSQPIAKDRPAVMRKSNSTLNVTSFSIGPASPQLSRKFDNNGNRASTPPQSNAVPVITADNFDETYDTMSNGTFVDYDRLESAFVNEEEHAHHHSLKTMTPQEISIWIDRRSRFFFPCLFLCFNVCYFTYVTLYNEM